MFETFPKHLLLWMLGDMEDVGGHGGCWGDMDDVGGHGGCVVD